MKQWMEKINKKNLILWTAVMVLCVTFAFAVELLYFNYHPLFDPTPKVEFAVEKGEALGTDADVSVDVRQPEKTRIEIQFGEPVYYRKLNLVFSNYRTQRYTVTWIGKDTYGARKETTLKDIKKGGYRKGVTNIEDEITSLTIEYVGTYRSDITFVKISNSIQLNRYRLVLLFSIFFIILFLILKRDWFKDRLPLVFFVLSFVLCLNYWFIEDIMQSGWDENVHFVQSYAAALGEDAPYTKAIQEMEDLPEEIWANTYEEHRMMIGHFNRAHEKVVEGQGPGRGLKYKDVLYLPYIILIKVFSRLGCSFYQMYSLTKLGSMLCYILIMCYAIKIAKTGKLFLVATGLMPTRLFINSTYNYDSLTVAFLTLGFVLWLNEVLEPDKKLTWKKALGIVTCFVLGSIVKQVYIGFVLLMLFLPESKFQSRRQKKIIIVGFIFVGVLITLVMVGPMIYNYCSGIYMGGDWRGGETSLSGQLSVILSNPLSYICLLFKEVKETLGEFLLGRFPYVNFSFHRRPETRFCYITAIIMLVLFFLRIEDGEEKEPIVEGKYKIGIMGVITISVLLIWSCMYLVYTPVGADYIQGVQARYYAPLIYPLMCAAKSDYISLKGKKETINYSMIIAVILMNVYCIYTICFKVWSV